MNRPSILTKPGSLASSNQNIVLFRVYIAYRSLLSVVLLIMLVSPNTRQMVGVLSPALYTAVALAYLGTNVVLMGSLFSRLNRNQHLLFAVFLVDIIAITLLADSSRGMSSGLPFLLVITVASSAVLISNRTLATLIAAISVLATLADTTRLILLGELSVNSLFPAGLLGVLIFGVSLIVQAIAVRLGRAEELARHRAGDLYNLQRLNEQIVQHMQTGILLVGNDGVVRVMNKAASSLLAPDRPVAMDLGRQLADYSDILAEQFEHWNSTGLHRAKPFSVQEGAPDIMANFRTLQPSTNHESLVFIEDYTPFTQYAQSLKLTSLGRLTASIAHEVRNPLGAISHAAQLLQESTELTEADQRMADIIVHQSVRLNAIIESVMDISRRAPPKPEYLLLCEWLEEFASNYLDSLNRDAEITIDCDYKELLVEFDQENLQRVMTNLLDNALRHSKIATNRETARILVEQDFRSQRCIVSVIDKGEGVPAADRAKLFEPFFTTVEEGSGMGLYLCKELCEINNATLSYRPTRREESCFSIAMGQRSR